MKGEIKKNNSLYPKRLKGIKNPPEKLYYKGNPREDIFSKCLAVVGSRKMTKYGEKICDRLVSEVASRGITIVSGFMYGIDATAHKAAVSVGGNTIAVMPCGIEKIHPAYQKELYKEIIDKDGLIVSEMDGKKGPAKWIYPKRNRIVAGLSQATLVVQAARGSGSLITANYAKKFDRKLFAVPGPLTSKVSIGTANLIKEGADIVTCAKDIIDFYKPSQESIDFNKEKSLDDYKNINQKEKEILKNLQREPLKTDELARRTDLSAGKVGVVLSQMQLKGLVEKEGDKYYFNL